jgi:hypothetical protein
MQVTGTNSGNDSIAIIGTASNGERTIGVRGESGVVGVQGIGNDWNGVEGISRSTIGGAGVFGVNDTGVGVKGLTKAPGNPAILGVHLGDGPGVMGQGILAGLFEGNVGITGSLTVQGVSILDRIDKLETANSLNAIGNSGTLTRLEQRIDKLAEDVFKLASDVALALARP